MSLPLAKIQINAQHDKESRPNIPINGYEHKLKADGPNSSTVLKFIVLTYWNVNGFVKNMNETTMERAFRNVVTCNSQ